MINPFLHLGIIRQTAAPGSLNSVPKQIQQNVVSDATYIGERDQTGVGAYANLSSAAGSLPEPLADSSSLQAPIILKTVKVPEAKRQTKVPLETLDRAQELLHKGDRGGAYLALYEELGNEQLVIQAQITTYTGIWGSGALTGNYCAQRDGGDRYNTKLDDFSTEIAQATIDAVRKDLESGGTGRISDDQLQSADRGVWAGKGMANLFPGNVQFVDFWNHEGDDRTAFLSQGTWNVVGAAVRSRIPNTSLFGLNQDGRNVSHLIGKRPAEFANNPNYEIHGASDDRFIIVKDKRTGFIEAFWDKKPHVSLMPMPQLDNEPIEHGSPEMLRRKTLYNSLGANLHRPIV